MIPTTPEDVAAFLRAEAAGNGGGPTGSTDPEGWPTPGELPTGLPSVPPCDPSRLLPPALAPWVQDIAERAQCPADYVTVGAVVGASALVGRQVTIRPKRQDDWTVVPNLWGAIIGRPGILKTPALREALRPLHRLAEESRVAYEEEIKAFGFEEAMAKARRELLQARMKAAAKDGGDLEALRAEFARSEETQRPVERRYVVNDATVEKLGVLLNQNPNGLLVFRDEISGFLRMMDREGHENDRAFYCEAWDGKGSYVYDRIGRGSLFIEAACVSLLGGIQPGPLQGYLREAVSHGRGDDGLIQRLQLMVFPDTPEAWRNVDRWPDTAVKNTAYSVFQGLARLEAVEIGAQRADADAPPHLRFTPEAQEHFDAWRAALEHRLRAPGEAPAIASHLAKYRSLMPSLALLFHLMECVNRGRGGPVSESAAALAIDWCEFLEPHARRVYHFVTARGAHATLALAQKIRSGALAKSFRAREVLRNGWSGLTDMADVLTALDWLIELRWLRRVEIPTTRKGGRATNEYAINPMVRQK